ncbi:hypothetical protein K492DRAFT_204990 [Lichtheimia hyalospora FSU 10163]|nr:hypothetical protein K492DRAFT_204990 [Lichtheimia hyalospora FSU 10163]
MIRGDCTSLPNASLNLAQANAPSANTGWSSLNENDTIPSSSLDHTKRKRNDSFGSQASCNEALATRTLSVDNATATQNLLAEYLQNAEQQQGIDRRPGRKPLNQKQPDDDEDPKVKRKVQNRAAQRAFRERKERYVRELELKIQHIQASHMQTTSQLTQENQYLRFVIHRLKTELSTVKGIPVESIPDLIPALNEWQQQQQQQQSRLPPTPNANNSDLAPFLTMSSQPIHATPTPIAPAPPRSRPIAPAGPAPIAPRPNHATTSASSVPSLKRPIAILPQSSNNNNNHQHQQPSIPSTNNTNSQTTFVPNARLPPSPEAASASNSSTAALYVRFSPQETARDQFGDESYLTSSPVYEQRQTLFNTNASGSSAGSHHSQSPPYMSSGSAAAGGSTSKEDVGEKAVAVDEVESEATRIQTVWRRLNLYGRFTDFSFDQLCRVAQMADGNPAMQRAMDSDTRIEPSMEDWELDKLMHQIDPDHL